MSPLARPLAGPLALSTSGRNVGRCQKFGGRLPATDSLLGGAS
jgi:hypothetical protein